VESSLRNSTTRCGIDLTESRGPSDLTLTISATTVALTGANSLGLPKVTGGDPGSWPGPPNDSTVFPAKMNIDCEVCELTQLRVENALLSCRSSAVYFR
jgi:hypothetical protein